MKKLFVIGLALVVMGGTMLYDRTYDPCWNTELCSTPTTPPTLNTPENMLEELEKLRREVEQLRKNGERLEELLDQYQKGSLKSA